MGKNKVIAEKISLLTIKTAIELAKNCRSKRQIIKELEKWLAEIEAYFEEPTDEHTT